MTTPAFLVRVLNYVRLSARVKIQPEDRMCCEFAGYLRAASFDGRLRGIWFHPAQELCHGHRTGVRAAISRAMGMHVGVSDFVFMASDASLALEAKHGRNGLTQGQDDFRAWCESQGVPHRTFRTVEEGFSILAQFGFYS